MRLVDGVKFADALNALYIILGAAADAVVVFFHILCEFMPICLYKITDLPVLLLK